MTVNTLGSGSRLDDGSFASGSSRGSRTVAEWLWPFCIGCFAIYSISALVYYHLWYEQIEPAGILKQVYPLIYGYVGWAPAIMFFLLVATWSGIWIVTGRLERPLARLGRLVVMTLVLGVALNLGSGAAAPGAVVPADKGAIGVWLGSRLINSIGYIPSLLLVWPTTFAALMLATDWFFSDLFERSRSTRFEVGVEDAVTDHLRGLSGTSGAKVAPAPVAGARPVSAASPQQPAVAHKDVGGSTRSDGLLDTLARPKPPAHAAPEGVAAEPASDDAEPARQDIGDDDETSADEPGAEGSRPLSYAERRRLRALGRSAVAPVEPVDPVEPVEPQPSDADEQFAFRAGADDEAESAHESAEDFEGTEDPEDVDVAEPAGGELDRLAAEAAAAAVSEQEIASLFGEGADAPASHDASPIEVASEHGEVDEVALESDDDDDDGEQADDEEVDGEELEDEELDDDEDVDAEELDEEEVDEEEVDEEELEDDEEVDEEELEDDEEELDDEELDEDEEYEDEDEEVDEEEDEDEEVDEEEEYEDDDEELEDDEEYEDEEVDEYEDDEEQSDEEQALAESAESDAAHEPAAAEAEAEAEAEADTDDAVDSAAQVAIPRPAAPVDAPLPTPPRTAGEREQPAASRRQQQLFSPGLEAGLVAEAVELVQGSRRRVTASLLQRKLRIDYELAAEVLAELERRGDVGDGSSADGDVGNVDPGRARD